MNLPGGSPSAETRKFPGKEQLPEIVIAGISHTSAPVELRECLAFSPEESRSTIRELRDHPEIQEIMILSTCNRVEMLITAHDPQTAIQRVETHIARSRDVNRSRLQQSMYTYTGSEAVRHLFRVASSLDSMVVGEPQILG
ncbi:MAG: hypothetical protein ACOC1H_03405, partial [Desulfosalsimonas sp.]